MKAQEVVQLLGLAPHPEGGYYRETFRDQSPEGRRGRKTAIYFLLERGQVSSWHRVDASEMWHYYAGAPLLLSTAPSLEEQQVVRRVLGPDLLSGERPQLLVEPNTWQSAESRGDWTLVGCTVSPAFEFSGFTLAPDDVLP